MSKVFYDASCGTCEWELCPTCVATAVHFDVRFLEWRSRVFQPAVLAEHTRHGAQVIRVAKRTLRLAEETAKADAVRHALDALAEMERVVVEQAGFEGHHYAPCLDCSPRGFCAGCKKTGEDWHLLESPGQLVLWFQEISRRTGQKLGLAERILRFAGEEVEAAAVRRALQALWEAECIVSDRSPEPEVEA